MNIDIIFLKLERKRRMKRVIVNQNKCNFEFKCIVEYRANELIDRGFIIERIKYKKSKNTRRYTGAIIDYISRT
ncbi:MAG: hypothetical protein HFF36_04125 [Coprobacillus sp.]|nr:hypothetical protein [Coprobacillus sp.]